jgi:hypothetical protein
MLFLIYFVNCSIEGVLAFAEAIDIRGKLFLQPGVYFMEIRISEASKLKTKEND